MQIPECGIRLSMENSDRRADISLLKSNFEALTQLFMLQLLEVSCVSIQSGNLRSVGGGTGLKKATWTS